MTTRGCAQQDYSYQTFRRGQGWTTVTRIEEEVYSEGCFTAVGADIRRHETTYCFCSGDLCNGDGAHSKDGGGNDEGSQLSAAGVARELSSALFLGTITLPKILCL